MRAKITASALFLSLAAVSAAAEFDVSKFPVSSEAEARFRAAISRTGPEAPGPELFRTFLEEPSIPINAALFALAERSPPLDAAPLYEKLAAQGPSSPFHEQSLKKLAAISAQTGDAAAETLYLEKLALAAEKANDKAEALRALMECREKTGQGEKALALARELFIEHAARPAAQAAGELIRKRGKDPLETLTDGELNKRGKILFESGSREKAVETLSFLIRRNPAARTPGLDLTLGRALHYLRRYTESLEPLSSAAKKSKDPETIQSATFWRARSLFGLDRGDEGAADLVKLAKRYPSDKSVPMWLYQAYRVFEGRRMDKEANAARTSLIKNHPASNEAMELRFTDALGLYSSGRYEDAAKAFSANTNRSEGWLDSQARFWKARSLEKAGKTAEAADAYAGLAKTYPVGFYTRASEHYVNAGEPFIGDPRGRGMKKLAVPEPGPGDLPAAGPWASASALVRLGMPEAARKILNAPDAPPYLRYFAEDFHGALKTSGSDWHGWSPPGPQRASRDPKTLYYPLAYPASVAAASAESDVHPHLVLAIAHTESNFDPDAYSPWEARGLMQFIPDTARRTAGALGIRGFTEDGLYDPATALRLGARHLRELLDAFGGDVISAVAAYNAGEAAVRKWREKSPDADPAEFVERIPYKETRRYVKKVLTAIDAYDLVSGEGLWPRAPKRQ